MKRIVRLLSVVILVSMVLTGCASGLGSSSEKQLVGWVYAGEPISTAELSIYDTNGKQILKRDNIVADEQGAIVISVKKLPSDFKIVTTNGELLGEAFNSVLRADVRGFNVESDKIYINLVTTMVGAYLDKKPEATLDAAQLSVKVFLELPDWYDLGSGTQLSGEDFNNEQFLSESRESGGINSFIDNLLTEMEEGKTHPFKEVGVKGIASSLALALGKGAASYVGGELMGWGLSKAGIDLGGDHTAEEMEKINKGMEEMKSKMNEMSIQLDAINDKLKNIENQLKDMLKTITHQQALSEYSIRVSQMSNLISSIDTIQGDLNYFIANPKKNTKKTRESLINRIENSIVDNGNAIHNYIVGMAGEKSLITLWREIVYEDLYLDSDDYARIKTQFDFFKQYQEAILLLRVEYYHAMEENEGDNEKLIMDTIARFNSQIEQQEKLLPLPIEKYTVIDTKWDGLYYSENIELGKVDSTFTVQGKTKAQTFGHMDELVSKNYAGFNDWKPLNYDYITALLLDFKPTRAKWNWSEYLISHGWPGKPTKRTVVPFKDYNHFNNYPTAYFFNEATHYSNEKFYEYPDNNFKNYPEDSFFMIMVYRRITPQAYGYEHLK